MAVAAAQKNREMFAIKKSYSIEVSRKNLLKNCSLRKTWVLCRTLLYKIIIISEHFNMVQLKMKGKSHTL